MYRTHGGKIYRLRRFGLPTSHTPSKWSMLSNKVVKESLEKRRSLDTTGKLGIDLKRMHTLANQVMLFLATGKIASNS